MNPNIRICTPSPSLIEGLRQLWKNTFGDSDIFLDMFFETAFSKNRCLCATMQDSVIAALYWFDCEFSNRKIAYIYAVATDKEFRGQGICHALMTETHLHLKKQGYAGAILSPAEASLFDFYKKMGYETCAYRNQLQLDTSIDLQRNGDLLKAASLDESSAFANANFEIREISKAEFATLRHRFLPQNAVIQEHENLDFLEQQASFYTGDNFLLTGQITESPADSTYKHLYGIEFLGDISVIPFILQSLGCTSGTFRTTGNVEAVGMYYSFSDNDVTPEYLGFLFD